MSVKPWLFIDVDGVLNTFGPRDGRDVYKILGYTVMLRKSDGKNLLKLTDKYDLIWGTTWCDLANVHIGPKIGLPELPYIEWSDKYPASRLRTRTMIKTIDVVEFCDGRPFAWLDDDLWQEDIDFLQSNCDCLPIYVNEYQGLVDNDFERLREWTPSASTQS